MRGKKIAQEGKSPNSRRKIPRPQKPRAGHPAPKVVSGFKPGPPVTALIDRRQAEFSVHHFALRSPANQFWLRFHLISSNHASRHVVRKHAGLQIPMHPKPPLAIRWAVYCSARLKSPKWALLWGPFNWFECRMIPCAEPGGRSGAAQAHVNFGPV